MVGVPCPPVGTEALANDLEGSAAEKQCRLEAGDGGSPVRTGAHEEGEGLSVGEALNHRGWRPGPVWWGQ